MVNGGLAGRWMTASSPLRRRLFLFFLETERDQWKSIKNALRSMKNDLKPVKIPWNPLDFIIFHMISSEIPGLEIPSESMLPAPPRGAFAMPSRPSPCEEAQLVQPPRTAPLAPLS